MTLSHGVDGRDTLSGGRQGSRVQFRDYLAQIRNTSRERNSASNCRLGGVTLRTATRAFRAVLYERLIGGVAMSKAEQLDAKAEQAEQQALKIPRLSA